MSSKYIHFFRAYFTKHVQSKRLPFILIVKARNIIISSRFAYYVSYEQVLDSYTAACAGILTLHPIHLWSTNASVAQLYAGIGEDGHIAFNEPGSSLTSRTRIKSLAVDTITANSRFFKGNTEDVPKSALTVGVGTVMDAREVC